MPPKTKAKTTTENPTSRRVVTEVQSDTDYRLRRIEHMIEEEQQDREIRAAYWKGRSKNWTFFAIGVLYGAILTYSFFRGKKPLLPAAPKM